MQKIRYPYNYTLLGAGVQVPIIAGERIGKKGMTGDLHACGTYVLCIYEAWDKEGRV